MPEDPRTGRNEPQADRRLDFEVVKDVWQEIRLEDGTLLRLKLVVTDVYCEQVGKKVAYKVLGQLVAIPTREPSGQQEATEGKQEKAEGREEE